MTILVTGATGNIGRLVVNHLIDLGANDIRVLTKNPVKADLPDGVTPVTGYLGESLPAALDGVERMYLAPLPPTLEVTLDLCSAQVLLVDVKTTSRCAPSRVRPGDVEASAASHRRSGRFAESLEPLAICPLTDAINIDAYSDRDGRFADRRSLGAIQVDHGGGYRSACDAGGRIPQAERARGFVTLVPRSSNQRRAQSSGL